MGACPSVLNHRLNDLDGKPMDLCEFAVQIIQLAPLPEWIAAIGRFDLDDLCAKLCKQTCAERPGNQLAKFQHLDIC